jgi:general secretion pathway protein H
MLRARDADTVRIPSHEGRGRRARAGMTIIEMLVVIVLIAFAATAVTWSLGALTSANLGSASMTFTAAARYAYNRAIAQGTTVRIVLDLDSDVMSIEEAHGRVTLARVDDATRLEIEKEDDRDTAAVDPWEAAQARLGDVLRPSFGASPFSRIPGSRFEPRPLANGISIERLIVPHEPEPRTAGQGAIYFFPGGQTEHAVVWLGDGSDHVYSLELHPLTGRTRIHDYAYEPAVMLDDGRGATRSEVED